jgi:hypothetical protein
LFNKDHEPPYHRAPIAAQAIPDDRKQVSVEVDLMQISGLMISAGLPSAENAESGSGGSSENANRE